MLAAREGVTTPESWDERSVVIRKRPHDDRREARGKSGRSLSEVKSPTSELSTTAESVVSRRSMGVVSCLDSSEPADCKSYEAENCTDATVSVHKEHMEVVSSCKAQEEIYVDQEAAQATMNKSGLQIEAEKLSQDFQTSSTVLIWIDGAWSGDSVSYKATICWCSTEGSRDRYAESKPMGDIGLSLGAGPRY